MACGHSESERPAQASLPRAAPEWNPDDPETWVRTYDPAAAWNGYTLAFYRHSYPILLDMRGRIVHSWPNAKVKSRARLLPDCSILAIGAEREIVQYSWEGELTWRVELEGRFPHHDLIRLANGHTLALTRATGAETDDILEFDRTGATVWEWRSASPMESLIATRKRRQGDLTHINSIQSLPNNPWFREGDQRFRPGNLLLSVRNLDLILIVDRETGEVVWTYDSELDLQHEALMVEAPSEFEGRIQIFNNRFASFFADRQSRVIEIDPRDNSTTWEFAQTGFFSPTSGAEQPLPNGNVLIVSSLGKRAFEVTRDGRTVWEWTPPFALNRSHRYAPEQCPELASLGDPSGEAIATPPGHRHIDRDAYRFSRAGQRREVRLDGKRRQVLEEANTCRKLLLPTGARAHLSYGIARRQLRRLGPSDYRAHFSMLLRHPETGEQTRVFEDSIDPSGASWREKTVNLTALEHREVEVCLNIEESGLPDGEAGFAFWGSPAILSDAGLQTESASPTDLTAAELEVRNEHLRAMGYVN